MDDDIVVRLRDHEHCDPECVTMEAADEIEDMRVAGSRLCDILLAIEADGYLDLSDQELLAIELWREASGE